MAIQSARRVIILTYRFWLAIAELYTCRTNVQGAQLNERPFRLAPFCWFTNTELALIQNEMTCSALAKTV